MNVLTECLDLFFTMTLGIFALSVWRRILAGNSGHEEAGAAAKQQARPSMTIAVIEGCATRLETVTGNRIGIGRDRGSDIVLCNEHASRNHAEIRIDGDRVWVIDLGSTNGTELNGQTVCGEKRRLRRGDVIRIGGENGAASTLTLN